VSHGDVRRGIINTAKPTGASSGSLERLTY
jgi:hypothetical protein